MSASRDLTHAATGASLPAPLVERLATSSVALRQNWLFTGDGQAVKLGVQADEMEDAAILIADMLAALQQIARAANNCGPDSGIREGTFGDGVAAGLTQAAQLARAAIAKAEGQS